MRRHWLVSFMLIVIILPSLAAQATGASVPEQQSDDIPLRIVWMGSPSYTSAFTTILNSYVTGFERQTGLSFQPEIMVIDWAEGRERILEMFENGEPPDLAVISSRWVPEFVSLGMIEPLDRYMTRDFRRKFIPNVINVGAVYQGRTFGVPAAASTRALFYNKDMLRQAGYENPPTTWDELMDVSLAMAGLQPDRYGFGLQGGGGVETDTYFYYFVWGNDGDLYSPSRTVSTINNPEAVEALTFLSDMIQAGATQPDPTSAAYIRRRGLEDLFMQGQLGMMISGPWMITQIEQDAPNLEYGIVPIPTNGASANFGVIDTLVMFSTSIHKDEVWQMIEFMFDESRRLLYMRATGLLPTMTSVADKFSDNENMQVFLDQLPEARFEPLHIRSADISQAVIDAIQSVYRGDVEPQAALDGASTIIDDLLATSVAGW